MGLSKNNFVNPYGYSEVDPPRMQVVIMEPEQIERFARARLRHNASKLAEERDPFQMAIYAGEVMQALKLLSPGFVFSDPRGVVRFNISSAGEALKDLADNAKYTPAVR